MFDAAAVREAVLAAGAEAVIHQLTDLAFPPDSPRYQEGLARNARLRIDGTRNIVAAARAAGIRRLIAQSIAFVYAPGPGARQETDPLMMAGSSADAVRTMEEAVLSLPEGIVLRYGFFYGPGTWSPDGPSGAPAVHIDAAAQACRLALERGQPGVYNIAENDPGLSSEKAKRDVGLRRGRPPHLNGRLRNGDPFSP